MVALLPYVEQENLYKAHVAPGDIDNPNKAVVVKTFLCPSDDTAGDGVGPNGWAGSSYAVNAQLLATKAWFTVSDVDRSHYGIGECAGRHVEHGRVRREEGADRGHPVHV